MANRINIKNKKAYHDYDFLEKYTAGIVLTGTEIKSIRAGKASLVDSFCFFKDSELFLKGMHITEYSYGTHVNHQPTRERKLLLTSSELRKIERKVKEKGLTLVATRLFINERGLAKVDIALARGMKEYDKREEIKKKDMKRDVERNLKM